MYEDKSLKEIIQEQEDEKLAKQYHQQIEEERLFLAEIELAQQLSLVDTHTDFDINKLCSNNNNDDIDENEDEQEIETDMSYDDYFVERQKNTFCDDTTVKPKQTNKVKKPNTSENSAKPSKPPGEGFKLPPDYDVSTSCGRVYKNRVPRPITTGASKTRSNGPLEIELNTGVPGLFIVYNFLTEEEETTLYNAIQHLHWDTNRAQTRRVQLYVPWEENPKFVISPKPTIKPLPPITKHIASKITQLGFSHFPQFGWDTMKIMEDKFCELQINEYRASDALGFHKDNVIAYTEAICGVSLLCDCWIHYQFLKEEVKVLIPKRSLYLLTGKARYKWKHGIPPDSLVGEGDKRISLTFRSVCYTKRK